MMVWKALSYTEIQEAEEEMKQWTLAITASIVSGVITTVIAKKLGGG